MKKELKKFIWSISQVFVFMVVFWFSIGVAGQILAFIFD